MAKKTDYRDRKRTCRWTLAAADGDVAAAAIICDRLAEWFASAGAEPDNVERFRDAAGMLRASGATTADPATFDPSAAPASAPTPEPAPAEPAPAPAVTHHDPAVGMPAEVAAAAAKPTAAKKPAKKTTPKKTGARKSAAAKPKTEPAKPAPKPKSGLLARVTGRA